MTATLAQAFATDGYPSGAHRMLLRDALVVDVNKGTASRRHILIGKNGIIEALFDGIAPLIDDAKPVDCSRFIVMPGFVNAHTHSQGSLARALGDRISLEHLLNAGSWFNHYRTTEELYLSALLGATEMVRGGCTTCYDLTTEVPVPTVEGMSAVASAYVQIGMRAIIAPQVSDRSLYDVVDGLAKIPQSAPTVAGDRPRPDAAGQLSAIDDIVRRWSYAARNVQIAVSPTIPVLCSDELMEGVRHLAYQHGLRIHTHLSELRLWAALGLRHYGEPTVQRLDRYGLLSPQFTGAHSIWLSRQEIGLLGDRGSFVVHNPVSNMRLGSGIAATRELLDVGVTVGVGTDACHCGDHLNMLEAARSAAYVSRIGGEEPSRWISASEALHMATAGSSAGLNMGSAIGQIEAGYAADLVFLDLEHVSFVPLVDAVRQIVLCADTSTVHSVMVGGRLLYSEGRFLTIDYDKLRSKCQSAYERLFEAQRNRRQYFLQYDAQITHACRRIAQEFTLEQ